MFGLTCSIDHIKEFKCESVCAILQTLSGHTSPVEYVKFNSGEDLVIAGSQSGTLKIWDLEAAKSKLKYNYQLHTYLKLFN